MILRRRFHSGDPFGNDLCEKRSSLVCQVFRQSASFRRPVFYDALALCDDWSMIHFLVQKHDRGSGVCFIGEDRGFDGGGAAKKGKERGMHVECSVLWRIEHGFWNE